MYSIDLSGKHAVVMGVANHRSLSWAIAQHLHQAGAALCLTYQGERIKAGGVCQLSLAILKSLRAREQRSA